jgi:hypothetical protein
MIRSTNSRRLYNIAAAIFLARAGGLFLQVLWAAWRKPLYFDDAYMFARYAMNVRHGLGISWNLDGVHTYGETSLLWGFAVLVLSFLPLATWKMLTLGSWLCAIGALVAMTWAVARNAQSELFRSTWRVLPWVALPLVDTLIFSGNATNGMETMLAALLGAVFLGMALAWSRGTVRPEAVALTGLLFFLARPDALVVVVLLPALLFLLMPGVTLKSVVTLLVVFAAGVALDLLICKMYFHTALPLSFYMKSRHAYEGYRAVWHPELLMLAFFAACQVYLAALVLLARRQDWRMIFCCVAPPLLTFAYFGSVTQIMGFNARYYAPYFAFFVVPALLVVDRWWAARSESPEQVWFGKTLLVRGFVTAGMMVCFVGLSSEGVQAAIRHAEHRTHVEYDQPKMEINAAQPLPETPWDTTMTQVTDLLVTPLPAGATVAATEVGYLGRFAPQVNVIDLAGLNDNEIALHGFSTEALLVRKPDLIWMPNTDYTYQRGLMLSDPAFLAQYELYDGAANYGLAVRKDSPIRSQIEKQMEVYWSTAYPGLRMDEYLVRSASWTGQKHTVRE